VRQWWNKRNCDATAGQTFAEAGDDFEAERQTMINEVEKRIKAFIDKFDPHHQKVIRAVRKSVRKLMPTANELVYDNYNFFVIGYSSTERPSDSILSIAAGANGVGLCFIHGARLPDPKRILLGSGNQTRFIRLDSTSVLARTEVRDLLAAAIAQARTPLNKRGERKVIIRSVSMKQRPRRKRDT
jgi:hypothetical protein